MTQDLRVKKSLAAIRNGFIECVEQKAFQEITVQDICENSMVNRSTFYKYYKDKYDLKEQILACEVEAFRVMVDIGFLDYLRSDIYKYKSELSQALALIKEKESIYKLLWSANMEANVFQDMQTCIEEKIKFETGEQMQVSSSLPLQNQITLFSKIFAASAMTTIRWWMESINDFTTEQVSEIILSNIQHGTFYTFFGDKK